MEVKEEPEIDALWQAKYGYRNLENQWESSARMIDETEHQARLKRYREEHDEHGKHGKDLQQQQEIDEAKAEEEVLQMRRDMIRSLQARRRIGREPGPNVDTSIQDELDDARHAKRQRD